MSQLTIQNLSEKGMDLSLAAADVGGDAIANNGHILLVVQNDDVSAKTVTVTAQTTSVETNAYGELDKSDAVHSVPAGGIAILGPFPAVYTDGSGNAVITYSDTTSLSVAALHK